MEENETSNDKIPMGKMTDGIEEGRKSRSDESKSDEDDQQMTERSREQEDKIWGLGKELDDG